MITSENNQYVRRVRALLRSTRRRFKENTLLVEGVRVCRELMRSSCQTEVVLFSSSFLKDEGGRTLLATWASTTTVMEVDDAVFSGMAGTETPQGILALAPIPNLLSTDGHKLILIPDQVRDPGNLGTLLRTAWATGVTEVLITPGTVDHTNPKVVRAGMGAHFYVPVRSITWDAIIVESGSLPAWVADAAGETTYSTVNWNDDSVIIVGGEADGASEPARVWGKSLSIPMAEGVESLNAAIAGSVILFEAFRQRRDC